MITLEQLKAACTLQGKVRRCEEEGMILPYNGTIARMVLNGFIEYEEGLECLMLLGTDKEKAKDQLRKVWFD